VPGISAGPAQARQIATKYAGFWIRVAAAILDSLLLLTAGLPLRALFGSAVTVFGMNANMPIHDLMHLRRLVRLAIALALAWAYRAGMESSSYQATLGKLAVRLKVTDEHGNRLSFARATARHFAKYLSLMSFGIGYFMVGFDEEKQGLHDRIAGTRVQYRSR
jgi:uncharacterized RDD family membrane protein YckC